MKIENKIILSNIFNIGLILLIGLFSIQNLNAMLTKLRFVEIADDLNASFLEMRISEKNYFLYHDETSLFDIGEKINTTRQSVYLVRKDIIRAIGQKDLDELNAHLESYAGVLEKIRKTPPGDTSHEAEFRASGKKLREFSKTTTELERKGVNAIIERSKNILLISFLGILLIAILVSHYISQKILFSLRAIEKLARTISEGAFTKIEGNIPEDEFGSVITAVNSMSEELRNREEELIQSKKLASLGILTAGVAHELTNPLNNISMIAQTYMEMYASLSGELRIELMNKIEGETERIKEIVKNLLDFSRNREANLQRNDINAVVRNALKLVQNMLDVSSIDTRLNLQEGLPPVCIDEHQIQQVLINLVTNSVQAMTSGGRLFMTTRRGKSGSSVEVAVMDNGKGIPPEFLPHVFDPFFSTKGDMGTGLGLSVSYGIIKNHKGDIRVESKTGVGSTFTIELPIYNKEDKKDAAIQDNDH
jgi:signal transduction histidine kinase